MRRRQSVLSKCRIFATRTIGIHVWLGRRQVARQRTLDPPFVGSNPAAPALSWQFQRGMPLHGMPGARVVLPTSIFLRQ